MSNKQQIIIGKNGIVNGEEPCLGVPKVNGRHITLGDLFDLYATEWGKPHNLICFYQLHHWLDLEVLQWRKDVNGKRLPNYLETIFPDFDCDAYPDIRSYSN